MARQRRQAADQWQGAGREEQLSSFFGNMLQSAQRRMGRDDCSLGTEDQQLIVGLPLPALCLRFLFQTTVFPLSRIIQLVGEEGSCKSAFLYELFRWHLNCGGGVVFMENEGKDAPDLRASILGWNPQWLARVQHVPCYSLEDWQDGMTHFMNVSREMQDAIGGPGRTIPIIVAVDSIMGTGPREEIERIKKEGHAARNYALAANLISQYMRTMPAQIKNYPFTIAGTNHLKPSVDARGLPTANIPGGKSVKFMETFEIEMKRAQSCDIDLMEYGGIRLDMKSRKSSVGPSRRKITAELLWWWVEDQTTRQPRQETAWDWDTATIEMICNFGGDKSGKKTLYNQLMEVVPLRDVKRGVRTAVCPVLTNNNEPTHFRILGRLLEQRPDLLAAIYPLLRITQRPPFQPGVDYRLAQQEAREEAERIARESPIGITSEMPQLDPLAEEEDEDGMAG